MNQFVKPIPAKNVPKMVVASIWIAAIAAPGFVLHTNLVEAAKRDAEASVISQVATAIKSSASNREEVMKALALHEREVNDGRYIRTANRLGIPMDWRSLFSQIRKRDKAGQQKAARIIAEECGLASDTSLKGEQIYLADAAVMVPVPVVRALPIDTSLKKSVN
jgi:hypothetical protein